jgi:hypothetical protein
MLADAGTQAHTFFPPLAVRPEEGEADRDIWLSQIPRQTTEEDCCEVRDGARRAQRLPARREGAEKQLRKVRANDASRELWVRPS